MWVLGCVDPRYTYVPMSRGGPSRPKTNVRTLGVGLADAIRCADQVRDGDIQDVGQEVGVAVWVGLVGVWKGMCKSSNCKQTHPSPTTLHPPDRPIQCLKSNPINAIRT